MIRFMTSGVLMHQALAAVSLIGRDGYAEQPKERRVSIRDAQMAGFCERAADGRWVLTVLGLEELEAISPIDPRTISDNEMVPGKHRWFGMKWAGGVTPCCRWCGAVRRRDRNNKECRGLVPMKVTSREGPEEVGEASAAIAAPEAPGEELAISLRGALVAGLWDARDSGEEVAELAPFIERDAEVILRHLAPAVLALHGGQVLPKVGSDQEEAREATIAKLVGVLRDIAADRGACSTCGKAAEGRGAGVVSCEPKEGQSCTWESVHPRTRAEVALKEMGLPVR